MLTLVKKKSGKIDVEVKGTDKIFEVVLDHEEIIENVLLVHLKMKSAMKVQPNETIVRFEYPGIELHSKWNTHVGYSRGVMPDWYNNVSNVVETRSSVVSEAPIETYISYRGDNQLTIAVSDAQNPIKIMTGINEESTRLYASITLFGEPIAPIEAYELTIRLDMRHIPYYQSINDVQEWWASSCGYRPIHVPEEAKSLLYSTWYSFHQHVDPKAIVEQCRLAKEFGAKVLIVDDGWQTDDNNRGYQYCGDWQVAESKIPNMHTFVEAVHEEDMKILFWYSVPFVGRESQVFKRFTGKFLDSEEKEWCILDPRFKEVREYLVETYKSALLEWDIDGFKLDFVDEFTMVECKDFSMESGRDYCSVPEAVNILMKEITETLKAIKPDILIEFRQSYIGPLMRTYGNIFRATDCPNDSMTNRLRVIDLRLLSGDTAVHSDMLMWSPEDTDISVALQLINILYSVPQISVMIDQIPAEQRTILEFWMSLWNSYKEILLEGDFMPLYPESNYSLVMAKKDNILIAVSYGNRIINLDRGILNEMVIVNGTYENQIIINAIQSCGMMKFQIFDCCGNKVDEGEKRIQSGINSFEIPSAGMLKLKR